MFLKRLESGPAFVLASFKCQAVIELDTQVYPKGSKGDGEARQFQSTMKRGIDRATAPSFWLLVYCEYPNPLSCRDLIPNSEQAVLLEAPAAGISRMRSGTSRRKATPSLGAPG